MATKNFFGSDCSGSDGDSNRVLTLSNTKITIAESFEVFVGGLIQHQSNITVSHLSSSSTITFLDPLYDDSPIIVNYNIRGAATGVSTAGKLPFNQRFIQKQIGATGNLCTVTEVSRTYGADEYRTKSEVETDHTNIPVFVHMLSFDDDSIKQGEARDGDLKFWFDYSFESILAQGNRITWDGDTYQITDVRRFKTVGDNVMIIECITSQI